MAAYAIKHIPTGRYLAFLDIEDEPGKDPVLHLGFVSSIDEAAQGTRERSNALIKSMLELSPVVADGLVSVRVIRRAVARSGAFEGRSRTPSK